MTGDEPAMRRGARVELGAVAFAWACHFFVAAAVIGCLLRTTLDWPGLVGEVVNWRHAHSHVAFLGWVFNGFFALAVSRFVPAAEWSFYRRLFWPLQAGVLGALVAFPVQGYGAVSIAFSSVDTLATMVFVWRLVRRNVASAVSKTFLNWSVFFLLLSAAGPLALGPLAAAGLRATAWYSSSVYFYLHFHYNGWFIFFLLAVFWAEAPHEPSGKTKAVHLLALGTVLTYSQSLLWLAPGGLLGAFGALGAALQLLGLWWLAPAAVTLWKRRRNLHSETALLLAIAGASLVAKCFLQAMAVVPWCERWVSDRAAIIGFLHLVFLGVVTPALLGFARERGWLVGRFFLLGSRLVLFGGLATGCLLAVQAFGVMEPLSAERGLLGAAGVLVLGGALLLPALRLTHERPPAG